MNIVVVVDGINLSNGGGVGSFIYDLCSSFLDRLQDNVYLVGIVKMSKQDPLIKDLQEHNIEVIELGANDRRDALIHFFRYKRKLNNILFELSRIDKTIVNMHLKLGSLYGCFASLGIRNVKCVETYHNTYHHYFFQCLIMRPFIKKYICVSNTAKEEMHRRFYIPNKKLIAIPNGVNREKLRALVDEKSLSKNEKILAVTVGRLSEEKNILTSEQAIAEMSDSRFTYLIIGDGPQRSLIEKTAVGHSNIIIKGQMKRKEVLEELNNADIVIMPSLWEGRSILMLEAAAFDKPFILSDVPGLREPFGIEGLDNELFKVCEFGYLVKTNEKKSYQMALKHFAENQELAHKMQEAVCKMSRENDMKKVSESYLNEFEKCFSNK